MGFVARLRRGTRIINLNASPFTLSADFVPPNVAEAPQIAENNGRRARRTGERRTSQALTIRIHAQGTTIGYIRSQVDVINTFLKGAGKYDDPTLFEWRPDNYVAAGVILGQGVAYRNVEIIWGEMVYGGQYGWWDRSRLVPDCALNLVIGPSIDGLRQLAAQAKGGISEDWIGTLNGHSRGVRIPDPDEGEGNWLNNPIFSHPTWNDSWTDGAGMDSSKNTDPEFVVFGTVSARLASTSSTTGTFTASVNVGDTDFYVLTCYAMRKDHGVLNTSNCQLYWNTAAQSTGFTLIGNGVYRLETGFDGRNAATAVGILVMNGNVLYVDGFQLEKRAYSTPLMCGDFLGHAWLGSSMDSRSVRNTGFVRYPVAGLTDSYTYTIRIGWLAPRASVNYTIGAYYILQASASANFRLGFSGGPQEWIFMAGSAGARSFTANEQLVFHIVCDRGSYTLYINGVVMDTFDQLYLDPTSGYLYLGSDATPANYAGGLFNDFLIYDGALSATEALADYNNILPALTAGDTVSPVLYAWSKDGDNVADYMDNVDGTYENIIVIGGIPGSLPAKTEIKATVSGINNADVYIGNLDVDYNRFINPEFLTKEGSPDAITVNTSDSTIATLPIDDDEFLMLAGKRLAVLLRGDEDGANNISLRLGISPGGAYYNSKYAASTWIASGISVSADLTPELTMVLDEELYRLIGITRAVNVRVQGKRPTGSATFNLHSAQIIPFPMIRLINTSASGIAPVILYIDGKAYEVNSAALSYGYTVEGSKREFGLLPGKYNLLISSIGTEGVASDNGDTLTYNAIYVTPRWAIL